MKTDAVANTVASASWTSPFVPIHRRIGGDGGPVRRRRRSHKIRQFDLDADEPCDFKVCASPTAASQMAHFLFSEASPRPSSCPEPSPQIPVDHQLRRLWQAPGSGDSIELTFDMAFECPNEEPHGRSTDEESSPEEEKEVRRRNAVSPLPRYHVTSRPIRIPYWDRKPYEGER